MDCGNFIKKSFIMMKEILIILIALFSLYSCGAVVNREAQCPPPKIIEVPIIQKCEIPNIPEPQLHDLKNFHRYDEKLQKLIENYGIILEDNKRLREIIKICK